MSCSSDLLFDSLVSLTRDSASSLDDSTWIGIPFTLEISKLSSHCLHSGLLRHSVGHFCCDVVMVLMCE